jgi:hypothetical protein
MGISEDQIWHFIADQDFNLALEQDFLPEKRY